MEKNQKEGKPVEKTVDRIQKDFIKNMPREIKCEFDRGYISAIDDLKDFLKLIEKETPQPSGAGSSSCEN